MARKMRVYAYKRLSNSMLLWHVFTTTLVQKLYRNEVLFYRFWTRVVFGNE